MKLIHTSDWHLGHTLYNYDRTEEQQAFLQQLAEIVEREQPDALLVSGDVYHYSSPSASVQKMYTEAMLEIHRRCPSMTIVVTAGNHDSSSKLEITRSLWESFGLHVIGSIQREEETVQWSRHIIEVTGKDGRPVGYILPVPHVYPQNFPSPDPEMKREERMPYFFQTLLDETKRINTASLPVVLMAHLAVTGSDTTGHTDLIGGMDYFPLDQLGTGYDYLALGHIHCPQTLKGSDGRARYCGTPYPVSFDETYPHSVSLVTVEPGKQPEIQDIRIENPWPCLTLPPEPLPFEEALQQLKDFPDDKRAYIRLNVLAENYLSPDCQERASEATRGKACRYCYIKLNRQQKETGEEQPHLSIQELKQQSPLEIARRYYQETTGESMDDELSLLLQEAMNQIHSSANE